jgi:hypothetical protein
MAVHIISSLQNILHFLISAYIVFTIININLTPFLLEQLITLLNFWFETLNTDT